VDNSVIFWNCLFFKQIGGVGRTTPSAIHLDIW